MVRLHWSHCSEVAKIAPLVLEVATPLMPHLGCCWVGRVPLRSVWYVLCRRGGPQVETSK